MTTTSEQVIAYGFCHCGCGQKTNRAATTDRARNHIKGEPYRFIFGHHRRKAVRSELRDCGYGTPCDIWLLRISVDGYGREWDPALRTLRGAHVIAWEKRNGPVPDGLELDHLCRVRACRNPDHLEPVTHAENSRRSDSGAYLLARTHCPQGHPYADENLFTTSKGGRGCRLCAAAARRRYKAKKASERAR